MSRRVSVGLAALRVAGVAALLLLLWNPPWLPGTPTHGTPLVLLDASLSIAGTGGRWPEALDSARRIAGERGTIWRFGAAVASFDTSPPTDGASRLGPAIAAAAAHAGPVTVITDGEFDDAAPLSPDLRARARVVLLARRPFTDAYVAGASGQRRLAAADTLRLRVSVGVVGGSRGPGAGSRDFGGNGTSVVVRHGERRLASRALTLPDSGTIVTEMDVPAARLPAGPAALAVLLEGAADEEPRDDVRWFVVEVAPRPAVVVLAAPPDWETRFLARELSDVVRAPVRTFVRFDRGGRWHDGATLRPVGDGDVAAAVATARLVVHGPEPGPARNARGARLVLAGAGAEGDWYVVAPPASPLAGALAGVARDSLPPLTGVSPPPADDAGTVALAATLARRGSAVPVVTLRESGGVRIATVAASGFWRWGFRGGSSQVAYRALVAGMADWLLEEQGAGNGERFAPVTPESPRGVPIAWQWLARDAARDRVVRVTGPGGERVDTLRFDAEGRAESRLAPGVYRYAAVDGPERGLVAVEPYSDEWRPRRITLGPQSGTAGAAREGRGLRDTWWLFALAIAAFAIEWYWRRREGLP
jgi:hypothetical protein